MMVYADVSQTVSQDPPGGSPNKIKRLGGSPDDLLIVSILFSKQTNKYSEVTWYLDTLIN